MKTTDIIKQSMEINQRSNQTAEAMANQKHPWGFGGNTKDLHIEHVTMDMGVGMDVTLLAQELRAKQAMLKEINGQ